MDQGTLLAILAFSVPGILALVGQLLAAKSRQETEDEKMELDKRRTEIMANEGLIDLIGVLERAEEKLRKRVLALETELAENSLELKKQSVEIESLYRQNKAIMERYNELWEGSIANYNELKEYKIPPFDPYEINGELK